MPFVLFHEFFPETAERETRSITVFPGSPIRLPPAHYGFLDMYCDEPGCDCRRVFLSVVSSRSKRIEAVVAWGWEDVEFYAKWMRSGGRDMALMLKGPALNMGSPETELAPVLLHLFSSVLLKDPSYVARIKRHYALFRDRIDGKRADAAHSEKVGAATATQ